MEQSLKNVKKFFVFTFIQTWFFYILIVLLGLKVYAGIGMLFLICGGMAPSLIGVIMAVTTYDKKERKDFFRRAYQVKRIGIWWWLFILLIFPVIHILTILISRNVGGGTPTMEGLRDAIQNPVSIPLILLVGFFFNGAFPEELGWRGFALRPLLNRFGFVKGNLLLGSIWAVWHMPLFFMPEQYHYGLEFSGFWFFLAQAIGLSMIMGLVFIKTKQSILSALVLHMLYNLASNMMGSYSRTYDRINCMIVFVVGIIISIYMSVPLPTIRKTEGS